MDSTRFGWTTFLTVCFLSAAVPAAQIDFEAYGDVGVGYSDGTTFYSAEEGRYDGHPDTSALSNFADPTKI